jgi:hypothetical protein
VANLLSRLGCLPPYRVLAGVEEDGRPLLLNLSDPARLPVLIAAEPGSGKTRLLHALVESALRLHSSADLRAVVLSAYLPEWTDLAQAFPAHLTSLVGTDRPSAGRIILELSALMERRLNGDRSGPALVVAIDDFTPLLTAGFDVQVQLRSLFDQGPQARIWPLVTIDSGQALNLHYWIDPFRTRILGKMEAAQAAQALAIYPELALRGQFCVWNGARWVQFWAPSA